MNNGKEYKRARLRRRPVPVLASGPTSKLNEIRIALEFAKIAKKKPKPFKTMVRPPAVRLVRLKKKKRYIKQRVAPKPPKRRKPVLGVTKNPRKFK